MAGPYYVDPDNGNDAADGLSTSTPWKLIPGQAGANSISGGSAGNPTIVNVKNGTTSSLALQPTGNYITYRGYGVATNILTLTLPKASDPSSLVVERVVRSAGSHEGMWRLVNASSTTPAFLMYNRVGITLEDAYIEYPLATEAVNLGFSASTGLYPTMRRCHVKGSSGSGISGYNPGWLIEYVKVENIADDGVVLQASVANGYRAGYTDTFLGLDIVEPGLNTVSAIGDAFQTVPLSARFESGLSINRLHVLKSSTVKQGLQLNDALGGFNIKCFYLESPGSTGTVQVSITGIRGAFNMRDGCIIGCANGENGLFRLTPDTGVVSASTAVIRIANIYSYSVNPYSFYTQGASGSAATHDGAVSVENCTAIGSNTATYSYSGGISGSPGSNVTIGAGASLTVRNNAILLTGTPPAILLPTGKAGSALYPVKGNAALTAATYGIGGTSYATLALFQAAHSEATGNSTVTDVAAAKLNNGHPVATSPLISAGVHTTYKTDASGVQFNNPPTIGAYEYIEPRNTALAREPRV